MNEVYKLIQAFHQYPECSSEAMKILEQIHGFTKESQCDEIIQFYNNEKPSLGWQFLYVMYCFDFCQRLFILENALRKSSKERAHFEILLLNYKKIFYCLKLGGWKHGEAVDFIAGGWVLEFDSVSGFPRVRDKKMCYLLESIKTLYADYLDRNLDERSYLAESLRWHREACAVKAR